MTQDEHFFHIKLKEQGIYADNHIMVDGHKKWVSRLFIVTSPKERALVSMEVLADTIELEGDFVRKDTGTLHHLNIKMDCGYTGIGSTVEVDGVELIAATITITAEANTSTLVTVGTETEAIVYEGVLIPDTKSGVDSL